MYSIDQYRSNGFASPIRVLKKSISAELADRVQNLRKTNPDLAERALGTNCHLLFPWLHELTHMSEILDEVEKVIGPDILLWSASFFIKDPGSKSFVSWHQDSTYWGLNPLEIVTAWLALTPSKTSNGCMRVIPGSHLRGQSEHKDTFDDDNLLSRGQKIEIDIGDEKVVDLLLEPGEMSLHHVRIFHSSNKNVSNSVRIGFAMRYIPAYTSQEGTRTFAELVRGEDKYRNFDTPRPPAMKGRRRVGDSAGIPKKMNRMY
jgi:Protein involved in biosynthesis of mitomycin antibiotics/polyketide fumonisin